MPLIFDPHHETTDFRNALAEVKDFRSLAKQANEWWKKIIDERKAKGITGPELYHVPCVHRVKKDTKTGRAIYRVLNLSPQYPGRLNLCEELLTGRWRLATEQEVEAEDEFQINQSLNQMRVELARKERLAQMQQVQTLEAANHLDTVQREQVEKKAATLKRKKNKEE